MSTTRLLAAACRWSARIIGTLLVLMIVLIAVGERMHNPFTQPMTVQVGFLALALLMIGILGAWRWELAGGTLSRVGWSLFVVAVMHPPRGLNWFVGALALPGLLYVAGALLRRSGDRHQPALPALLQARTAPHNVSTIHTMTSMSRPQDWPKRGARRHSQDHWVTPAPGGCHGPAHPWVEPVLAGAVACSEPHQPASGSGESWTLAALLKVRLHGAGAEA
jgi:hypothetical protein